MLWTDLEFKVSRNIEKVLVKNSKEDSGKCKTIIYIDGANVFTSDDYTWKHPDNSITEFNVWAGDGYTNGKFSIRNISITAYE